MLKLRSRLNLAAEPVEHHRACQLGGKDLQDDLAIERDLVCQKDAGHPTAAELSLDCVGRTEGGLQLLSELVGQYYLGGELQG